MKYLLLIILTLFINSSFGQKRNLARNGSFEAIAGCPTRQGEIDLAYDVFRFGSVDLFSVCGDDDFGVPQNALGNQWAADGYSMAGMIVSTEGYWSYEYLIGTLDTANMIDGQEYCLSVKVSLAEKSPYSINQLAFFFSEFKTSKFLYNENGYIRRVIHPWLNYDNRYNDPPGGRYSSGSNSYITPLEITPASPEKHGWITIKNTIIYQKEHDYYYWICGNTRDSSILTLENDNQFVFNPDRTVYYYIDDVKITRIEQDTVEISPELIVNCNQQEYIIRVPDSFQRYTLISDSLPVSSFSNSLILPINTDFNETYIKGEYDDYCDYRIYKLVPPQDELEDLVFNEIYPNPTKNQCYINVISSKDEDFWNLEIIDTKGRLVKVINRPLLSGLNKLVFDVSDLSSGVYFMKTEHNDCKDIQKIVIQN